MLEWGVKSAALAAPLSPRGKLFGSQEVQDCVSSYHETVTAASGSTADGLVWSTDHLSGHTVDLPSWVRFGLIGCNPATRIVLVGLRLPHFLVSPLPQDPDRPFVRPLSLPFSPISNCFKHLDIISRETSNSTIQAQRRLALQERRDQQRRIRRRLDL